MTRAEFTKGVAYLTAGSGKALPPESMAVYFDCLADLTFEAFAFAAKRVLQEHRFATFPTIAEIRDAAAAAPRPVARLSDFQLNGAPAEPMAFGPRKES